MEAGEMPFERMLGAMQILAPAGAAEVGIAPAVRIRPGDLWRAALRTCGAL